MAFNNGKLPDYLFFTNSDWPAIQVQVQGSPNIAGQVHAAYISVNPEDKSQFVELTELNGGVLKSGPNTDIATGIFLLNPTKALINGQLTPISEPQTYYIEVKRLDTGSDLPVATALAQVRTSIGD